MARRAAELESAEAAKTPDQHAAERREARAVLREFARRWQTLRDLATLAELADRTSRDGLWDLLVCPVEPAAVRAVCFTAAVLTAEQRRDPAQLAERPDGPRVLGGSSETPPRFAHGPKKRRSEAPLSGRHIAPPPRHVPSPAMKEHPQWREHRTVSIERIFYFIL
jgi:hypothetical protein